MWCRSDCGERNGNYDVYTIPAAGGEETRLTTAEGLDDGRNTRGMESSSTSIRSAAA